MISVNTLVKELSQTISELLVFFDFWTKRKCITFNREEDVRDKTMFCEKFCFYQYDNS